MKDRRGSTYEYLEVLHRSTYDTVGAIGRKWRKKSIRYRNFSFSTSEQQRSPFNFELHTAYIAVALNGYP